MVLRTHQTPNTFIKRLKCADFSALVALSSMASVEEDTGTSNLSLITYMPCHS